MPTYEYECLYCNHTFEAFQRMTDEPLDSCPKCGKKVRRLINGGMGIIFKGSGFYSTDNRSGGTNGSKKESESTPAPAKSGGDSAASKDSSSSAKKEPAKKES